MSEIQTDSIKFGVELETSIPYGSMSTENWTVNGYHSSSMRAVKIPGHGDWKAERDGSLHAHPGCQALEVVSPILEGEDGLAQVRNMCTKLNDMGAKVNGSMGLHVTVTFPARDGKALARLVHLVARHEKALYALTGTKRRERTTTYCKPIAAAEEFKQAARRNFSAREVAANYYVSRDRYQTLNLTHILQGRNRVEFRVFSGTTNATKIEGYVRIVVALVALALQGRTKVAWDAPAKTGSRANWKPGQAAWDSLRYALGWGKVRNDGRVLTLGGDRPDATVLREMKRLVRKYDAAV